MIIKMINHNSYSNWQIVFMSDTDKQQTLIDLYVKNLKEFIKSFRC